LQPWLDKVRRPAWKPVVEDGDGAANSSKFCGIPWTGSEAPWPTCGKCGEPLTPFLQLDLDDLPESVATRFGPGLLQLFYCVRDDCQGDGGWEPFADDLSRVRVVHPDRSAPTAPTPSGVPQFPARLITGWTQIDDLPDPDEHDESGLEYTYDFEAGTLRLVCSEIGFDLKQPMSKGGAEDIAVAEQGDKLGGWPAWVQGVEYPCCPRCERRMVLVFQVDSEDNVPFMFGDVGCGHITQCPEHKDVVAFGWACS
jgi:uncharacterized protein YwqG